MHQGEMYYETYDLWEGTSSDQSCQPEESAPHFLRLKCACSLHVTSPQQICLGLGKGLFMDCLRIWGGSHWGHWPGNQWDIALSSLPINTPADGHSLGLWLFPQTSSHFLCISSQRVSDVKHVEMLWIRILWWEGKGSLKSIWRMLDGKTGSRRQE